MIWEFSFFLFLLFGAIKKTKRWETKPNDDDDRFYRNRIVENEKEREERDREREMSSECKEQNKNNKTSAKIGPEYFILEYKKTNI